MDVIHLRLAASKLRMGYDMEDLALAPEVRSKALALSSSLPHAGDWLNVVPSPPKKNKWNLERG